MGRSFEDIYHMIGYTAKGNTNWLQKHWKKGLRIFDKATDLCNLINSSISVNCFCYSGFTYFVQSYPATRVQQDINISNKGITSHSGPYASHAHADTDAFIYLWMKWFSSRYWHPQAMSWATWSKSSMEREESWFYQKTKGESELKNTAWFVTDRTLGTIHPVCTT